MRILARVTATGFALLIAVLVAFYITIDVIAGATIEKGATYALGVGTKVGFVRIGLLSGSFRIGSLKIENPPGFEAKHLLTLGDGRLEVSIDSLQKEVVDVPRLALEGVEVSLEKEKGRTNYGVILANLGRFESSGSKPAPAESEAAASGKRFIMREILIRDVSAHVEHTEALGALGAIDVAVPEIRLKDVGAHNARGVAMSQLTDIIMKAIFEAIAEHGAGLPGVLAGELSAGLAGLSGVSIDVIGGTTQAVVEKLPESAGDAARKLGGETGKKVIEGLGGLLGGRKGDE